MNPVLMMAPLHLNAPRASLEYMKEIIRHLIWFHSGEISDLRLGHFPFNIAPTIWQLLLSLEFHLPCLLILTLKHTFFPSNWQTDWSTFSLWHSQFLICQFPWFLLCDSVLFPWGACLCNLAVLFSICDLAPIWSSELSRVSFQMRWFC